MTEGKDREQEQKEKREKRRLRGAKSASFLVLRSALWGLPGGSFPMQGAQVQSLIGELDPTCCSEDPRPPAGQLRPSAAKYMKVAQSCPTICNPMDYTVLEFLQARILGWVAGPFSRGYSQGIFSTQGLNPGLPHCKQILY